MRNIILGFVMSLSLQSCGWFDETELCATPDNRELSHSMPMETSGSSGFSFLGETNVIETNVDEMDLSKAEGSFVYSLDHSKNKLLVIRRAPADKTGIVQKIDIPMSSLSQSANKSGLFLSKDSIQVLTSEAIEGQSQTVIRLFTRKDDGSLAESKREIIAQDLLSAWKKGDYIITMSLNVPKVVHSSYAYGQENFASSSTCTSKKRGLFTNARSIAIPEPAYPDSLCMNTYISATLEKVGESLCTSQGSHLVAEKNTFSTYASENHAAIGAGGNVHIFKLAATGKSPKYLGAISLSVGDSAASVGMKEMDGHLLIVSQNRELHSFKLFEDKLPEKRASLVLGDSTEDLKAVRFVNKTAYVVTYHITVDPKDPLYVIDLSNAAQPTLKGVLDNIPGFSAYLHPIDDTHLLGLGHMNEGTRSGKTGIQLALFDVADPQNPKQTFVYTVASENKSEAIDDYHGFRFVPEKNMAVFSVGSSFQMVSIDLLNGFELNASVPLTENNWIGQRSFFSDGTYSMIGGAEFIQRTELNLNVDATRFSLRD